MLVAYNPRSGDLIQRHYPRINRAACPGMTPVYRTDRYVLVRVAERNPAAPQPAAPSTAQQRLKPPDPLVAWPRAWLVT